MRAAINEQNQQQDPNNCLKHCSGAIKMILLFCTCGGVFSVSVNRWSGYSSDSEEYSEWGISNDGCNRTDSIVTALYTWKYPKFIHG